MKMHHLKRRTIPFTSIVGQDMMKLALVLNAINPRIGGVLIRGDKGTAKSTAVRALADLLDEIPVVDGCPFNCNPFSEDEMCDICYQKSQDGDLQVLMRRMPVVDLPLGATEDRVVGSLDVERAIKDGIKALEPGILAAANRGILYIDEVNLLDDHVADVLLDAAAMGVNIVEREGVSVAHPSRFMLVGTMNPEEGELRPQLLDRFGLQVNVEVISDVDLRVEIAKRAERFESDPEGFISEWSDEQNLLRERIRRAKQMLPGVVMDDSLLRLIAQTCIEMGVRTHRAEIVTARTARTIAAFEGRSDVTEEDVRRAMMLALPHRMRSRPFEPPSMAQEKLEQAIAKHQEQKQQKHQHEHHHEREQERSDTPGGEAKSSSDERVFEIGSPIDVKHIRDSLRRDRVLRRMPRGRRVSSLSMRRSGRYLRSKLPVDGRDIAFDATIRAAAPYQHLRERKFAVSILPQDIREKERVRKTSATVLFVVDASGSMGAMRRMESAKGAVLSLLMDSYQKRDRIGMVAFRGKDADLLLPPCSSVDLALKRLAELPTGGRTPLSAGLSKALRVIQGEIIKNRETRPMMVLISDGRANVSVSDNPKKEIVQLAEEARRLGVHTVVIDTEIVGSSFMEMRLGYCRDLAEAAGGKYYPITEITPESLSRIVESEHLGLFQGG
ncbi:MAG: putative cobaltochelatase [Methanothrix sp.]|nr:putative cobaltochelatase [Methanothrix sp.]MCQ8903520.1 putative cobaltochelatase [Methanothrix sp.]